MIKKNYIIILMLFAIFFNFNLGYAFEIRQDFYESEFIVGFAELYFGINVLEGKMELIEEDDQFQEKIDMGRINLYLKGKIKGKYLLTAWVDTKEERFNEILKNISNRKHTSPFGKINSEKYYPIYGDDSQISSEIDTSGRLYLKLESEEINAIWGNYILSYDENQLINFRKNIYGANIDYENDFTINTFWNQPFSVQVRDELELTGGILYYLSQDDLIAGSENIIIERRYASSDRVIESRELKAGRDYEINYLQGRIILKSDIDDLGNNNLIMDKDGEEKYFMKVDYQYDYNISEMTSDNFGLEASYDFTDNLFLTANYIQENNEVSAEYILRGLNLIYENSGKTNFRIDYGDSKNIISDKYFSSDGGINYGKIDLTAGNRARAWNLEYSEVLNKKRDTEFTTFYTYKEMGFNSGSQYIDTDKTNYGFSLVQENKNKQNQVSYGKVIEGKDEKNIYSLGLSRKYNPETDYDIELNYKTVFPEEQANSKTLDGTLGFEHQFSDYSRIYGSQQLTLYKNDPADRSHLTTLGGEVERKNWRYSAEGTAGDRDKLTLGLGYVFNEGSEIYSKLSRNFGEDYSTETIFGGNSEITDKSTLTAEHRIVDSENKSKKSNIIGIDYLTSQNIIFSFDYSGTDIADINSENIRRDILGTALNYNDQDFSTANRIEYRVDRKRENFEQIIFKSDTKWEYSKDFDFISRIEYSKEKENKEDRYFDSTLGMAYRPIDDNRLKYLFKYNYLDQKNALDSGTIREIDEYAAEKSQVFSLDLIYDFNPGWQLTSKLAYKNSEVKLNSFEESWSSSQTFLWAERLNYTLREDIDVFIEYRRLESRLAADRKDGFLIGGYKEFDNNTKLGIGYNFTDFNDDLTDLNYEAKGWFINLIKAW